jgi:DNA-directed RNA polymerase specialized sigma24 family protein
MARLPLAEVADPRPGPPDRDAIERIEQLVARFPPDWRRVWDLWRDGTTREEIARTVGKSVRTVQYWLAEMLEQLRDGLTDAEP